jgi:serine phosphatase RsbU (regulator of sigma subunit)
MFHARVDTSSGRVDYADAGHGLTFLVRADGSHERLVSEDVPLGLGLTERWSTTGLELQPGDMIVSCSDGVLDLFDGTAADLDRIAALVARERSAAGVIAAVARLARDTVLPDDVTVIAARRELVPAAPAAA